MNHGDDAEPFICPLSLNLMEDPVIDPEGNSYERSVIESWLRVSGTSPTTRNPLSMSMLCPNKALKTAIDNYKQRRATLLPQSIQEADIILDDVILGRGSFGVVRKGYWRGTAVAIKTLVPDAAETSPALLTGLERELRLLSALRHANIIALYGHYRTTSKQQHSDLCGEGALHLVLEFGEGGCLTDFMRRRDTRLPAHMAISIALDIARGLWYLHAQKVGGLSLLAVSVLSSQTRVICGQPRRRNLESGIHYQPNIAGTRHFH